MSIESLFDHKCNIYHLVKTIGPAKYGLPGEKIFSYPDEPDEENIPCHFKSKIQAISIVQSEPNSKILENIILKLPQGTDVRSNDKVVDLETGYQYTSSKPRSVRGHHLKVRLKLEENQ